MTGGEGSSIGRGHRSGSSSSAIASSSSKTSNDSTIDVIAALDQGTQSTRVFLYRVNDMSVVASHQVELTQHFPKPGWVEHDPMEILSSVALCAGGALAAARAASRSSHSSSSPSVRVVALGITNQRESTIAWDRLTGRPLHRSIVWNDGRTAEICARVEEEFGGKDCFRDITGLPVSPYFSAYKMRWLLENVPAVKEASRQPGRLCFGTVDSWLIFHLTGGSSGRGESGSSSSPNSSPTFVTDVTNASRTGLMCLRTRKWHAPTCEKLGIDPQWLPEIASCAEVYGAVVAPAGSCENLSNVAAAEISEVGEAFGDKMSLGRCVGGGGGGREGAAAAAAAATAAPVSKSNESASASAVSWGCKALAGVPIAGCVGDQQAALLGQRCRVGDAKATYGTGAFVLLVTGSSSSGGDDGEGSSNDNDNDNSNSNNNNDGGPVASSSGLLTTAAYQLGPRAPLYYALEGAVAVAGAGVSWLRDGLGIIERPSDVEALARSVSEEGGEKSSSSPSSSSLDAAGGVVLVPAFAGLLAPRWRSDARGVLVGLTSATTKAHVARAMLDAICWQTKEVVEAMASDRREAMMATTAKEEGDGSSSSSSSSVAAIARLRVDGGASRNDLLMSIQADVLGLPVERPSHGETTSLGAALAAGVGAGCFSAEEAFAVGAGAAPAVFLPRERPEDVAKAYERWNDAVERSYGLA